MILGAYTTLANPGQVDRSPYTIMSGNLTPTGYKFQFTRRYYASTVGDPSAPIQGHRIRVMWSNLTATELTAIRAAHLAAVMGYVKMTVPRLGLSHQGEEDTQYVTVDPEDDQLDVTWEQGWIDGEGPIVYQASASFLTQTYFE